MSAIDTMVREVWPHGYRLLIEPNAFGVQLLNHPGNFRFGIYVGNSMTEDEIAKTFREWAKGWQDKLAVEPV